MATYRDPRSGRPRRRALDNLFVQAALLTVVVFALVALAVLLLPSEQRGGSGDGPLIGTSDIVGLAGFYGLCVIVTWCYRLCVDTPIWLGLGAIASLALGILSSQSLDHSWPVVVLGSMAMTLIIAPFVTLILRFVPMLILGHLFSPPAGSARAELAAVRARRRLENRGL